MIYDINIHEFARKFSDTYQFLYDSCDNATGFQDAVKFGNWIIKNCPDFVIKFNKYRGDILTSDREIAAFGFVMIDMMGE